jgi:hypothetical protein
MWMDVYFFRKMTGISLLERNETFLGPVALSIPEYAGNSQFVLLFNKKRGGWVRAKRSQCKKKDHSDS